ncbi:hypothetical protein ACHAW5_008976 [Stephanodiscus triporus]|uniref:Uncharacterized protein n=1 Tax=Stephanodiscus triporus TaxID=2934178 RepID=A0ABD3NB87_9STRA
MDELNFLYYVFEVEQIMYSDEGVDWTYITRGAGSVGVLSTLDDSGHMGTAAEPASFCAQLHQNWVV